MPLVTVCFDRIFDVVPGVKGRKEVTFFGFQCGPERKYAVAAPGHPALEPHTTVTAYLKEDDNWQSLVGWLDHSTGEVVMESPSYEIFCMALCGLALVVILPQLLQFPAELSLVALAALAFGGWAFASWRFLHRVREALLSLKGQGAAAGAPLKPGGS